MIGDALIIAVCAGYILAWARAAGIRPGEVLQRVSVAIGSSKRGA